jgi:hypothetical protein
MRRSVIVDLDGGKVSVDDMAYPVEPVEELGETALMANILLFAMLNQISLAAGKSFENYVQQEQPLPSCCLFIGSLCGTVHGQHERGSAGYPSIGKCSCGAMRICGASSKSNET